MSGPAGGVGGGMVTAKGLWRFNKYALVLAFIVGGKLVHADETEVDLQKVKGYVWVLTNMEDVVYMYRPSREAAFLRDVMKDFKGVLVSDFYSGYDSLPCLQQKCLIHLIRDFNDDLMASAYDEDFKALASEFATLLRSIVATVDKHGLKKAYLHQHGAAVSQFFLGLQTRVCHSEIVEAYQKRLLKCAVPKKRSKSSRANASQ